MKKQIWFLIDCPDYIERFNVCEFIEKHFKLKPKGFGSGKYNHRQADYYCFSTDIVRRIRSKTYKEFPKTKVIRW